MKRQTVILGFKLAKAAMKEIVGGLHQLTVEGSTVCIKCYNGDYGGFSCMHIRDLSAQSCPSSIYYTVDCYQCLS